MANELLSTIKIHIVSLDENIVSIFNSIFTQTDSKYKNISVEYRNIAQCESFDCIVSPANSFGQMDGGIDGVLSYMLCTLDNLDYIGQKVRKIIADEYYGEQPVGTCILVETDNKKYPYLAHSPTMSIPKNVSKTFNAFYAFKSVLGSVVNHNKNSDISDMSKITSILTTTFCTGCGDMSKKTALTQMKKAFDIVYDGIGDTWFDANDFIIDLDETLL